MAIFFYISNEGLSILENLAWLGVKIPGFLTRALEQVNKLQNNNEEELKKIEESKKIDIKR